MLGILYPDSSSLSNTTMLTKKEMVIYQNLYSHFQTKTNTTDAKKYAMMTVLKDKYHGLAYTPSDEAKMKVLLFAGK